MLPDLQIALGALLILLILIAVAAVRILREYERGVVFMLGSAWSSSAPVSS